MEYRNLLQESKVSVSVVERLFEFEYIIIYLCSLTHITAYERFSTGIQNIKCLC